jgi:hypothetical protein
MSLNVGFMRYSILSWDVNCGLDLRFAATTEVTNAAELLWKISDRFSVTPAGTPGLDKDESPPRGGDDRPSEIGRGRPIRGHAKTSLTSICAA